MSDAQIFRYAGFANEAEFGATPAPAATRYLDIASAGLTPRDNPDIERESSLGRGLRHVVPGLYWCEGDIQADLDAEMFAMWLRYALGDYTFTNEGGTASGDHLHEIVATDLRELPSFATRIGKDVFEHVFEGCVANQLQIQLGTDGLLRGTLDVRARKDARDTLVTDESTMTGVTSIPVVFWQTTLEIDGVDAEVRSFDLTIANNVDPMQGAALGDRYIKRLLANQRQVTATISARFEDTEHLERFWGGSGGPADSGAVETDAKIIGDLGDLGSFELEAHRVRTRNVPLAPSGRTEIDQQIQLLGIVDTEEGTEVTATFDAPFGDLDPA